MRKSYRIALVSGGADSAFHSVIATEMVKECKKYGHKIIWYQSMYMETYTGKPHEVGEMNIYNLIDYNMVDIVVILSLTLKEEGRQEKIAEAARKAGVPVISIDKDIENAYNVKLDYEGGLEEIIRHVITKHNARTFAFLTGMRGHFVSDVREKTFRTVLAEYGIPVDENKIRESYFWYETAEKVTQEWYDADGCLPDAIICANDSMAIGVANVVTRLGYKVPEDVIITGLDGIEEAMTYSPSITTAIPNVSQMVIRVVELVNDICGKKIVADGCEIIPSRPLFLGSCGCTAPPTDNHENEIKHKLYDNMNWFKNFTHSVIGEAEEISANADFETAIDNMGLFLKQIWSRDAWLCVCDDFLTDIASVNDVSTYTDYRREGYSEMLGYVVHIENLNGGNNFTIDRPAPYRSKNLVPDIDDFFDKYNAMTVLPVHFRDRNIGFIVIEYEYCLGDYSVLNSFDTTVMGMVLENARVQHELRQFAIKLDELHVRDPLTKLFNRRGFYRQVPKLYDECIRSGKRFMIISADLDELKDINDIHGHADGDNAIVIIARALESAVKNGEIVARFGGDEYVVAGICPTEEYGTEFVKNVMAFIDNYNGTSGKPYKLRTSCGVYSAIPDGSKCLDEFISNADEIMYEEKMLSKLHRGVSRRRM